MKQKMSHRFGLRLRRVISGVLCAVMLCGLLPEVSLSGFARAAEAPLSWDDSDLQTLNDYDIMRGNEDGDMMPDKSVTRAEFVAMVNRSLGYSETAAKLPFRDVTASDWFSDDVSIAYNMGYFTGTANAAASPQGTLTREQALVLLGRNLMLQPAVGESFSYADTHSFGSWSRGYIDPAVEAGIIDADRSADFNPTKLITRGELAGMLVRTIGTRVNTPGVKNLGTVDGNVTITTSNVTLRNTTINGDLYLTGGIGLGDVHLDNVTVNGRIMDAGAGLSEKGDISIVLNNVSADELVVDSMRNQTVSLRTSGTTTIPKTSVRTAAYLDDSTSAGYGLELIEVDGEDGTAVTLSGNIKEVHNKTPKSSLNIGEGVADKVTVDEAAAGSTVTIGKDARVKELNLDAGIKVDGAGSIDKVNISANGATVAQLPDEIVVAPGITATVNKQKMDTAAALEASSRPRLSSGYPYVPENNINPTGATALFMTNKPGTVYWALTAKSNGSPSEEEIISPPTYAKYILKSGKIQVKESDKEYTAKISGLTSDGSYYLSAILVDDRGTRSTMKVTAFDTPDNTTPAFAKDYPAEQSITEQDAQFAVMTTKSCYLYYALLPKGSTAPRAIDFQTGSISGNLGYGSVRMEKNNPANIFVNDVTLEEQQSYVLYLWLTDFDGAKSSAVKAINFTTQDKTNPIVSNLRQTDTKATSATMSYALSEQGTLYWAVVATGNETFMSPSSNTVTGVPFLQTQEAKERVVSGVGALKKGSSAVSAAKAGSDIGFTVSGLNAKSTGTSAYDLYYVARDKAGNWSDTVTRITFYTLDTNAPKVELRFTSFNEGEDETTKEPLGDTDIRLVFSKAVRVVDKDSSGVSQEYPFLDLYQRGRFTELAEALRKHVLLYKVPVSGSPTKARDETADPINYDIDYSKVRVYMDGTNMVVEFPYSADSAQSAHHLANGGEYYFELSGIQDTTSNHNPMAKTKLEFKTKQAQVNISSPGISELTYLGQELPVDFSFQLDAKATSSSPENIFYDILLWCDESLTFDLYRRAGTSGEWYPVGNILGEGNVGLFAYTVPSNSAERYRTVNQILKEGNRYPYDALRELDEDISYQYAVHIKSLGGSNVNRETWNLNCNMGVTIASGQMADLNNLAGGNGTKATWDTQVKGRVNSIGNPDPYSRQITISDSVAPVLANVYPQFDANDTAATMTFLLDRPGTIYYVVTPVTKSGSGFANPVPPTFVRGDITDDPETNLIPTSGRGITHTKENSDEVYLISPDRDGIISKKITDPNVHQGNIANDGESTCKVDLDNLTANTWYYVYLMFQGNTDPDQAVCYKFKTEEAYNPVLNLSTEGTTKAGNVLASVTRTSANVYARLIPTSSLNNTFYALKLDGSDAASSEVASNFTGQWPTASEASSYTILSAMMTRASGQNGSVFDVYATDDLKTYVANLIRTGSSGNGVGSISSKSLTIAMGKDGQMVFDGLAQNLEYFCVAVAENTSNTSKRGFSAVRPVEVVDTNPATVTNATGNLRIVAVEDPANNQTIYVLTGTVSISYAGYLYVNDGDRTTRPFTQGGSQTGPFFDVTTSTGTTTWAGAQSVTSINSTGMFEVRPTGGSSVAAMTQTLVLSVVNNLNQYPNLSGLSGVPAEGYVLETRAWTQATAPDGSTTWEKPDYPTLNNSILFPTEIVNRNGTTPTNTGSITYTNVSGGKTGANVTVSYKK